LAWLPPLLVGASAAVAAEVALALLLYGGPGFVRSLTTILAVEGLSLAGGLWSAPVADADLVDRLRRRWLFCLLAFVTAAAFGTLWTFVPWLGEARAGQAVGLAAVAALPLYAAGSVLGGMSVAASSDPGRRLRSPGAAAAAGAAIGFVLTGLLLPRAPMPGSLLVGCLVMLSLGAMVFGNVLGARTEVVVHARRPGVSGDVTVEERRVALDEVALLELSEGGFVRRRRSIEEEGRAPWDVSLARALLPDEHAEWRVLIVGGGGSSAAKAVLREHPSATVDVLERSAAVVELGREFFDTDLRVGGDERMTVAVGNLDDALAAVGYGYHLVLVDTAALAPLGGLRGLSGASSDALFGTVTRAGVIAWGPVGSEPTAQELPDGWQRAVLRRGAAAAPKGAEGERGGRGGAAGAAHGNARTHGALGDWETLVLTARPGVLERLPLPEGFHSVEGPAGSPGSPSPDALAEARPR
jgi:hypothetical protein